MRGIKIRAPLQPLLSTPAGQCEVSELLSLSKDGLMAVVSMLQSKPGCGKCVLACAAKANGQIAAIQACVISGCLESVSDAVESGMTKCHSATARICCHSTTVLCHRVCDGTV